MRIKILRLINITLFLKYSKKLEILNGKTPNFVLFKIKQNLLLINKPN